MNGANPGTWRRTVYNMYFRMLGDRRLAKRLTKELAARLGSPEAGLLLEAAGLARDKAPGAYATGAFPQMAQILEAPLPEWLRGALAPGRRQVSGDRELKEDLPQPVLGILELLYNDRLPAPEIAVIFGITPRILQGFLLRLADHLTALVTAGPHPGPCPSPAEVVMKVMVAALRTRGGADGVPEELSGCSPCRRIAEGAARVVRFLERDSRIVSLSDEGLVDPIKSHGPKAPPRTVPPLPEVPVESHESSMSDILPRPTRARLAAAGLAGVLLALLPVGRWFHRLDVEIRLRSSSGPAGVMRIKTAEGETVTKQTRIRAEGSARYLKIGEGIRVELAVGGELAVWSTGVEVLAGKAVVTVEKPPEKLWLVQAAGLAAVLESGAMQVAVDEAGLPWIGVDRGVAEVRTPEGSRRRIQAGDALEMGAGGRSRLVKEGASKGLS